MSEPKKGSKVVGGIVVGVLWVAMFVLPSACIIAAGKPRWLALAVGLAAFPLAPLGWHAFGEWRRKRALKASETPPKTSLTAFDRLMLRTVVVAIVAIGGTIFIARGNTLSSLRHTLWFTDWSDPDPIADSPLLSRVPANAEFVLWAKNKSTDAMLPFGLNASVELVVAGAGDDTIVIMHGKDPAIFDALEPLVKVKSKDLARVEGTPKSLRVLVTPKWRDAKRGAPAMYDVLRRAPSDANLVVAGRGGRLEKEGVTWAVAWAHVRGAVEIEARAEAVDISAADKLIGSLRNQFEVLATASDCGLRAFARLADRELVRDDTRVRGRAKLPLDAAREIPACMSGSR